MITEITTFQVHLMFKNKTILEIKDLYKNKQVAKNFPFTLIPEKGQIKLLVNEIFIDRKVAENVHSAYLEVVNDLILQEPF